MANLRKSRPDRIQDIHRHPLDGALRDAHLLADHLVDGQIVDRLFDTILRRDVAQLGRNGQIDRETVADLALQLVATVQRMELHAFERNAVLHYSTMIR